MSPLLLSGMSNWLEKYIDRQKEKVKVVLTIIFFAKVLYQINITICMIMIGMWMVVLQNHLWIEGINHFVLDLVDMLSSAVDIKEERGFNYPNFKESQFLILKKI